MLVVGDQAPHEDAVVSSDFRGSEGTLGSGADLAKGQTLGQEEQL